MPTKWLQADAFEDAIENEPINPVHRLVYSDWLEEEIGTLPDEVIRLRKEAKILSELPSYTHIDGFLNNIIRVYVSNENVWLLFANGQIKEAWWTPKHAESYIKLGLWIAIS
jgi:uncharacterized protein (TIGR02996 family)